jgi:hypothetical protein
MKENSKYLIPRKSVARGFVQPLKIARGLTWLALLWALLGLAAAQTQPPPPAQPSPQRESSPPANSNQPPASDKQSAHRDKSAQAPAETRISPQEAEELFRSVDKIIKFSSEDTGLPIRHEVKRRLISRDELASYLEKHMEEDKDSQRLKRSELVLKKFGLLPRNFDLHAFLIALLREQVAGYYDVKTKTVNLLDWVDAEQQKPVLAHELTHALQDQSFHLEKWMKAADVDLALSKKNPTPEDIEKDEAQTVRQAVVEGQAMAVLVDYMLAPTGQSLTTSPEIVEALKAGMLVGTADSVQFQNAPVFLKELLTFPYRYGLDFVSDVLTKEGKQKAFAGILANPPRTTREIMEPKTYLAGEHVQPIPLPDFAQLLGNYQKFDVGSMGEFDVALLLDEYAGPDDAKAIYPEWRGGYYYAARPKGDPNASLAIVYVSQWSSAEVAAKFADIYREALKKRYRSIRLVNAAKANAAEVAQTSSRNREWLTEDGDVVMDIAGATVFITESLDDVTSAKLRDAVLNRAQESQADRPQADLPALSSAVSAVVNAWLVSLPPSQWVEIGTPSPSR